MSPCLFQKKNRKAEAGENPGLRFVRFQYARKNGVSGVA